MDNLDDSGIDSDQKISLNEHSPDMEEIEYDEQIKLRNVKTDFTGSSPALITTQDIPALEYRAAPHNKDKEGTINDVSLKRNTVFTSSFKSLRRVKEILPRTRRKVPSQTKKEVPISVQLEDKSPLIEILSDSEEDEFESPMLPKACQAIRQQLIKDGYNLDVVPDDEDLDLIPPRPFHERSTCCQQLTSSCRIS